MTDLVEKNKNRRSKSKKRSKKTYDNDIKKIDKIFGYKEYYISVDNSMLGDQYNLGYGEIKADAMNTIVKFLKQIKYPLNTYIDLGCGNGRSLAYAITYGFRNAKGIEIVEKRYYQALDLIKQTKLNKIKIQNYDIFNLDKSYFPNKCVIFISNLLFPKETTQKLIEFLSVKTLKCIIFMTVIPDNLYNFELLDKITTPMSWYDTSSCYILQN